MKNIKSYLAYCAVFALLLAGCSKENNSAVDGPDANSEYVDLSFGALLNDLSNRAMSSNSKAHFDQIPDCSDETPAVARIQFSYGGETYNVDVDILFDGTTYFTDYSEELKIPVEDGGTTTVTLEEFMVYDGDPDGDGNLIWIAPISSEVGQFDGYVDNPLPFDIEVQDGTKPYIDVEVLCYDRRMTNEYGYVFFDIEGKELIEFCVFGNFCPPSGRHYVASYSLDVWIYEDGEATDHIYDGEETRREVTENAAGEWAADPLCVVLPDDPDEEDEYLIEITILEGPNYDATEEVIRRAVLTDVEVRSLFDGDDNLEYFHFFEGCGEDDNPPIFEDPREDDTNYKACITELNDSGVVAFGYFNLQGNTLESHVIAFNTEAGMVHPQHIHGFENGDQATCPDESADENNDGLIDIGEGGPFYGPVLLPLNSAMAEFPTADGSGYYMYSRTFTLTQDQLDDLGPLEKNVVVLHGLELDGGYEATLPVGCGPIKLLDY